MEFKRKCFLGHKPDKIKEGKLENKKRMEARDPGYREMKDLVSSIDSLGKEVEGTLPVALRPHHNAAER